MAQFAIRAKGPRLDLGMASLGDGIFRLGDAQGTPFDDSIMRYLWRRDALVPVVGGALRERRSKAGLLPPGCPTIRYPSDSYMGRIIASHERRAVARLEGPTAVESAFSVGMSRLVAAGVGAGWTPHSIAQADLATGRAVTLSADYGRIPLDIVLFVRRSNTRAATLIETLSSAGPPDTQSSS
ncbi:hypothetical protein DRW48_11420 [Paracoccus suum]|uniref:Uncharacterized protein n=1 Tax=Paracoccus suum TaxID=2259340 RepID=A0A344PLG8_9RHOB|nr:LysR substrate-binding domain-containing protein [Paracoccus suum]AXC50223.1 hypothetical protein DRW48_11420 [Paracoccus suum]